MESCDEVSLPSDVGTLSNDTCEVVSLPSAVGSGNSLPSAADSDKTPYLPSVSSLACSVAFSLPSSVDTDSENENEKDIVSGSLAEPNVPVPAEIDQWLHMPSTQIKKRGMELYSVPRVLAKLVLHFDFCLSFDIANGWDFDEDLLKRKTYEMLSCLTIVFLFLSPPCTMFSELQRLFNYKRMDRETWRKRWAQACGYIDHSMDCALLQIRLNRKFMYEHPWKASSWELPSVQHVLQMDTVKVVTFDMCAVGMTSPAGLPVRKRTSIMTNSSFLYDQLVNRQCCGCHEHRPIEGSERGYSMSKWCQKYPAPLVEILQSALHFHSD